MKVKVMTMPDGQRFVLHQGEWVREQDFREGPMPSPRRNLTPPDVRRETTALEGANVGLAGLLDLPSKVPLTLARELFDAPVSTQPYTDLMTEAGIIPKPGTTRPTFASRLGEAGGGSVAPMLSLEAAGARAMAEVGRRASPLVESFLAAPGRARAGEPRATLGGGAGMPAGAALGGPTGEAVGGLMGAMTPAGTGAALRGAYRGTNAPAVAANVQDFQATGVPYTAGQVSSPTGVLGRFAEQATAFMPGGNVVAARGQDLASEAFGRRLTGLTPRAAESDLAGLDIKKGVAEYAERFNREAEQRYGAFHSLVEERLAQMPDDGLGSRVALDDTRGALQELEEQGEAVRKVIGTAGDQGTSWSALSGEKAVDWNTVRKARSAIGRKIGNPGLHAGEPIAELKQVYAALTRDMERAASHLGDDVLASWQSANQFYREGVGHLDDHLDMLVASEIPERIFRAFSTSVRNGPTIARWYKDALSSERWERVRDTVLQRMGEAVPSSQDATGGKFSSETFLTGWNQMDDSAKNVLVPQGSQLRENMDQLARVADNLRRSARTLYNTSGTAGALTNIGYGTALMTAAMAGRTDVASAMLGQAALSAATMRMMQSKPFVDWLTRTTRTPVSQLPARVNDLETLADENPELEDEIMAYGREWTRRLGEVLPAAPSREGALP